MKHFTLIELLVILAILCLLACVVYNVTHGGFVHPYGQW